MKRILPVVFLLLFVPAAFAQGEEGAAGAEPTEQKPAEERRFKETTIAPDTTFLTSRLDELERELLHLEDKLRFLEDRIGNLDRRVDDLRHRSS